MKKKRKIKILGNLRNLLLFILLSASSVWGRNSYSQETKLTLDMKNVTLEQVFDKIRKQSQFEFIYNNDAVDGKMQVSVCKRNCTIDEVLENRYFYTIKDRYILICVKEKSVPQ